MKKLFVKVIYDLVTDILDTVTRHCDLNIEGDQSVEVLRKVSFTSIIYSAPTPAGCAKKIELCFKMHDFEKNITFAKLDSFNSHKQPESRTSDLIYCPKSPLIICFPCTC